MPVDIELKIGHDAVKFNQRALCSLLGVQREALGIGGDHLGIIMTEAVVSKRFDLMRQMDLFHAVGTAAFNALIRETFAEVPVQIPEEFSFHNLPSFSFEYSGWCAERIFKLLHDHASQFNFGT